MTAPSKRGLPIYLPFLEGREAKETARWPGNSTVSEVIPSKSVPCRCRLRRSAQHTNIWTGKSHSVVHLGSLFGAFLATKRSGNCMSRWWHPKAASRNGGAGGMVRAPRGSRAYTHIRHTNTHKHKHAHTGIKRRGRRKRRRRGED